MKVSFKLSRFTTLTLPATCLALAACVTACGDDDGGSDDPVAGAGGTAGKGGSTSGGSGGKGGGGSSNEGGGDDGGKGGGGTAGNGVGGEGAAPTEGGAGGEGAAPTEGGADGGAGEGPGPAPFHANKINGADGTLVPQVHDLRGLTYSASGKIWAVGYVGNNIVFPGGVDRLTAVVRFNGDGTLDNTFDGDGVKTFNLRQRQGLDENVTNDGDEQALGVVELPNGDIIVQANVRDVTGKGRDVVLLKLNSSGGAVNFAAGANSNPPASAVRKVDFGWTDAQNANYPGAPNAQPLDESWGIALNADGTKLAVFGHGPAKALAQGEVGPQRVDTDRYVTRVTVNNGLPDQDFNAGPDASTKGVPFTFNTGGTNSDGSRRGNVEADGAIVSAGYTNVGGSNTIFVARLLPSGQPDKTFTFGTQAIPGVFASNPFAVDGGIAECYAAVRQSTGRYVTTGYGRATAANGASTFVPPWQVTQEVDLVSFGLKQGTEVTGGSLDLTFGVAGTLAIQSEGLNLGGTEDRGRDAVVVGNDRVVFAGRLGTAPALFVTTAAGKLDTTEGGLLAGPGGTNTVPGAYLYAPLSGVTSHFFAIAKSKDGKRVAATTSAHADGALLAVLNVE